MGSLARVMLSDLSRSHWLPPGKSFTPTPPSTVPTVKQGWHFHHQPTLTCTMSLDHPLSGAGIAAALVTGTGAPAPAACTAAPDMGFAFPADLG